jgi:transmembrane sensor
MSSASSHPPIPLPAPTAAEQAALEWFARCDRGLSAEQEAEFEAWLVADPRHATLFNEMAGTWRMLAQARAAAVLAPATTPARPKPARPRWARWTLPLAAAASLALAYVGYWRPTHYAAETVTAVGAQRTLRLPDGSVVNLNTDSVIAADFSAAERRVRLARGEATFSVAKHAGRPFIVEAGGVAVRAVGTAFNVRLAAESLEVIVLEGRVEVNDAQSGASLLPSELAAEEEAILTPGQSAIVALPDLQPKAAVPAVVEVRALPAEEVRRRTSWQEGRLDFEAAPLAEIVAEFNRYHRHKLVIADPALETQRFGGSFRPDDQAGFVRMLQENFHLQVERFEQVTILRGPPRAEP